MKKAIICFAVGLICFLLFAYLLCATLWIRGGIGIITYIVSVFFVGMGGICTALSVGIIYDWIKETGKNIEFEQAMRSRKKDE